MLEAGALGQDGVRVLILPHAIALSDAEVQAIKTFAQSGGTVLADTEPGLFDGHSRLRATQPLTMSPKCRRQCCGRARCRGRQPSTARLRLSAAAGVFPRAVFRIADGNPRPASKRAGSKTATPSSCRCKRSSPTHPQPASRSNSWGLPRSGISAAAGSRNRTQRLRLTLDPVEPTILALTR